MVARGSPGSRSPARAKDGSPLTDKEVEDLAVRLLDYSRAHLRMAGWRSGSLALARGMGAEDVARKALMTLFTDEGKRKWNPAKYPDPWKYLVGVVDSYIDALARSKDRWLIRPDGSVRSNQGEGDSDNSDGWCGVTMEIPRASLPLVGEPADDLLERAEERQWVRRAEELLLDRIAGDRELADLYDAIDRNETEKPRELASALGWTTAEVKNIKKRLKRAFDEVVAQVRSELGEGERT